MPIIGSPTKTTPSLTHVVGALDKNEAAIVAPLPAHTAKMLTGWRRRLIDIRVGIHIFLLAIRNYKSIKKSLHVVKSLYLFKKSILGSIETKLVKLNGKYYHSIYAPGYPSITFNSYIEAEFNRILPLKKKTNKLTFIFFAITSKCPLRCEHCFEWNNLNKKETFTRAELQKVVSEFERSGISQFHLSGGEPMVRVNDVVKIIGEAGKGSEFYVLTSGFNFTSTNAKKLKQAGLTGVVISLDHYDAKMHNAFRGFNNSYDDVINAIENGRQQSLLITLSLCATRAFTTQENLMQYGALAKKQGVSFIQILEPKAVGHYGGKDVFLDKGHFEILDEFYEKLNFNPEYKHFPIVIYHGYYQRRVGCLSGSNRSLYIDSEGYVNACPFCHTKSYNIKDGITLESAEREIGCPKLA